MVSCSLRVCRGRPKPALRVGLLLSVLVTAAAAGAAPPEYFTVRPDVRLCIAPLCGGFFVDPVNRRSLRCADGERREECYVADIDLSALEPGASISVSPLEPPLLVRGVLEDTKFDGLDVVLHTLVASELWEPAAGADEPGLFVRLSDSGIRCVTTPCDSTLAEVLNRPWARRIAEVDLGAVGLDERQLEEARARIGSAEGLIAAGRFFARLGRDGARVRGFAAAEVYFPFPPTLPCETDADCGEKTWCRPGPENGNECVPFVGPGESCGGFVLPWFYERCEPGLQCVPSEPTGDLPGTCATCSFGGTPYQAGESFPAGDGCNVCSCLEGGRVLCTEIGCSPLPECQVTGCSGQLCVDAALGPIPTTCEFRPEYECLRLSRCGNFGPSGGCAWAETADYRMCLDEIASGRVLERDGEVSGTP